MNLEDDFLTMELEDGNIYSRLSLQLFIIMRIYLCLHLEIKCSPLKKECLKERIS